MYVDDHILELYQRVQRLEGQNARSLRPGTVAQVRDGAVRMKIGSTDGGDDYLTPWVPYSQVAGAVKAHVRPSVGQQMMLAAPGGDLRQAVALPFTWSEANVSPGSGPDPAYTYGNVRIEVHPGEVRATIGGAALSLTSDAFEVSIGGGSIKLTASEFAMLADLVKAVGSSLMHNSKEVGDAHRHADVTPGPSPTGIPV